MDFTSQSINKTYENFKKKQEIKRLKQTKLEEREKATLEKWNIFTNILARKELPRLNYIFGGYNYRIPLPGAVLENGLLKANVEFAGLDLRYTIDGSEPTKESSLFTVPIEVSGIVKIRAFDTAGNSSRTSTIEAE